MYTRWTQHLDTEEEKENYRLKILAAKEVLDHLKEMITEDEKLLDRSEKDQRVYDLPNWDYRQAHKNGVRQYMTTIQNLITLDPQEKL